LVTGSSAEAGDLWLDCFVFGLTKSFKSEGVNGLARKTSIPAARAESDTCRPVSQEVPIKNCRLAIPPFRLAFASCSRNAIATYGTGIRREEVLMGGGGGGGEESERLPQSHS
jgi:hypothetical protein